MFPVLFETKYFTLYTFWVFFSLGAIAAIITIIKLSIKNGLKIHFLSENSWKLLLWAILGARIFAIFENYKVFFSNFGTDQFFRLFAIWDKGLNIWGGILGFMIAFYFLCKKKDQNFFKWLDALVPALLVGLALGHLGAFAEGINYGHETSLPWGVNFESPTIKYAVPIHPTQIYAFIYSLIAAVGLILINNTEKVRNLDFPGLIGISGITIYSFLSFMEEFVRGDDTITILGIRLPQILALLVCISSGIFLYLRYNKTAVKK